jgi:16S rRNA (cytidine1402-2'-O)-methyltransferase
MKGVLTLLPNLLNKEGDLDLYFPPAVKRIACALDGLIAEDAKEGRAFLKRLGADYRNTPILLLNEHTTDLKELFEPLERGEKWGLISDTGLPLLADPGHALVAQARNRGVIIEAIVGPSAIVLALMLSGMIAQRFAFHGYLPKHPEALLKELEARSQKEKATQLFMEAPYRNQRMLETLLATLSEETLLCVAWDLTFPTQGVEMRSVGQWKKRDLPNLHKRPAIFLFNAAT